jgi:dienelactone hydrolase
MGAQVGRFARWYVVVLLFLLWLPAAARADFTFTAAYPGLPLIGPGAAKGAVIWNHGKGADFDVSDSPTPYYNEVLRKAGWDIFRLNRTLDVDNQPNSSREQGLAVERLKARGYQRIVLAGQSYGAWISFLTAARVDVHAVLAVAPAAYGTWRDNPFGFARNARDLYDMLRNIRPTRVMTFYFGGDDFDPGGRGPTTVGILADRGIDGLVVDHPAELVGHGAGNSGFFARRYGECMARFIDPAVDPRTVLCHPVWGRQPSGTVALPSDIRFEPVASGGLPEAAAYLGRWWGWYPFNGREVEIAIERIEADGRASVVYGLGPGLDSGRDKPEWSRRTGRLENGVLRLAGRGLATIEVELKPDGRLGLRWEAVDHQSWLTASLGRRDTPENRMASGR